MKEKEYRFNDIVIRHTEAMSLRAINRVIEKFDNQCKVSSSAVLFRHLTRIAYPFKKSMFYQHLRFLSDKGLIAICITPHVKRKQATSFHFTLTDAGETVLKSMMLKKFVPTYKNKVNADGSTDKASMHL